MPDETQPQQLRWPALLLAVALGPVFVWWTLILEEIYFAGWPTSVSIFYHCLCGLLVIQAGNALVRRFVPRLALTRSELLAIYTSLSTAVAVAGHDHQMVYLRGWVYVIWKAAHDPTWARFADLPWPRYIQIFDLNALDRVFEGFSTLYRPEHWRVWLIPILFLGTFLGLIQVFGACLNRVMVIPWSENERLTFPIAQLPLEMTAAGDHFWSRRPLWIAFWLTFLVGAVNGCHALIPAVPELPIKRTAIYELLGSMPPQFRPVVPHFICTFPWMIGLCFLLPKDLSLSVWVFFWLLRAELFVCAWLGWPIPFPYQTGAVAPHIVDQGVGAYLVIFAAICYAARTHFHRVWSAVRGSEPDIAEARGYRLAFYGALVALAGMFACLRYVGLKPQWALLAIVAYAIMVTVICKVRAEMGPPMYDLHFGGPDRFLALYVGPRNLSRTDWIGVGFLFGFNRGQRNLSLPHQTEGLWLQKMTGGSLNRLTVMLMLTGVLAGLVTCWGLVHIGYHEGFNTMAQWRLQEQGWSRIQPWFDNPTGPHQGALGGLLAGAVMAVVLTILRQRFIGFPLHPGGLVLATNWAAELMWFPMLLAWLAKTLILKASGVKGYRAALPFFLGLVLGDFVIGTIWAVVGCFLHLQIYDVTW